MKIIQLCACLLLMVSVTLVACGSQTPANTSLTPVPTTAPLQAVEAAIWAANEKDYDKANQLLDISKLAQASTAEAVIEHWNRITSNQRVASIAIREVETKGEAKRLFIVLQNNNYPTHNVGFWIRWQGERWVASENND